MYLQNYSCISYISDIDQVIASGRTHIVSTEHAAH